MAVTKGDSAAIQSATTGVTVTVSGLNKLMLVCVTDDTASVQNYNVTVGGNAATLLTETAGTGQYQAVYYYVAPADGSIVCDSDGGSGASFITAQVYYGVDQVDPFGTREGSPVDFVTVESASAATGNSGTIATQADDCVVSFFSVNGAVTVAELALTTNGGAGTNEEALDTSVPGSASMAHAATVSAGATCTHVWGALPANRRLSVISTNLHAEGGVAAPSITDVDEDNTVTLEQANVEIDGTSFDTATVDIEQDAIVYPASIDSQDADTITFDMPAVPGVAPKHGAATVRVTNDDDQDDTQAITIEADAGTDYVDIATVSEGVILEFDPVLATGDQVQWTVTGGVFDETDFSVNDDGTFDIAEGLDPSNVEVRRWLATNQTWSAYAAIEFTPDDTDTHAHVASPGRCGGMMVRM